MANSFAAALRLIPPLIPISRAIARAALLCNDASLRQSGADWIVDGDPMEGALIAFAMKAGVDPEAMKRESPRLKEIPFDSRYRFMATLNPVGADSLITVKGAPERVLELCASQRSATGDEPLDAPAWRAAIDRLAARGQRVIAFASKPARGAETLEIADVEEGGLTLLGLVGLIDPPRPEAVQAIAECKAAGIDVKMITGDHASTGAAIARELGLGKGDVDALTGHAIDSMDDAALRRSLPTTSVFARTSPEHKLRLVEALQADGAVVSMTGDGVNDAPALKRANVGVAMGRKGTEAAKEAAEMVLADDNFATIAAAVREGRIVYDNLVKVVGWALPTNGGQAMAIVAAVLLGVTMPMTPAQILWVNMVTSVALGLVFAFDPAEPGVMQRPPRDPRAPLLSGLLVWRTALVSALFCVAGVRGLLLGAQTRRGAPARADFRGQHDGRARNRLPVQRPAPPQRALRLSRHSLDARALDRDRRRHRAADPVHLSAAARNPLRHAADRLARHGRGGARRSRPDRGARTGEGDPRWPVRGRAGVRGADGPRMSGNAFRGSCHARDGACEGIGAFAWAVILCRWCARGESAMGEARVVRPDRRQRRWDMVDLEGLVPGTIARASCGVSSRASILRSFISRRFRRRLRRHRQSRRRA